MLTGPAGVGIWQRDRTSIAAATPGHRVTRTGILTASAITAAIAVGSAAWSASLPGISLSWLTLPATLAVAGIVAQTLWQHDVSARLTAAVAALLYTATGLTEIILSGIAKGTAEGQALLVLFVTLVAAAGGALGLAERARRATAV